VGVVGVPGGSLREPGGTPTGEAVREILLHHRGDIAPWTEALLYAAARAQLVSELVRPSLESGLIVVLDRYIDSSLAYQGCARGLGIDTVLELSVRATGGLLPDLTLLLKVDPQAAAGRRGGPPDRLEAEGLALQARVAKGYDELARRYPERILALDGERPAATVAADVEAATLAALEAAPPPGSRGGCHVR
jgi:dTMP kinase